MSVKSGNWLADLVEVYNDLGGTAAYSDVYKLAKRKRESRGATWSTQARATIRRTVEDHALSSANFRGTPVFYSVNGHGRGVWGLMPDYLQLKPLTDINYQPAYLEGLEGIAHEQQYLRRSRDPKLVEARKILDNYTCQVCKFYIEIGGGRYVIDVHHLNPLGSLKDVTITSIDDLVCLCPTCHRIAHSRETHPFSPEEVRSLRGLS